MNLSITGTVTAVLPIQSGEGRNGKWSKQEFVLTTEGDYPKDVCCVVWGDHIDMFGVREGETLTVHIDLASREYNGRWYTDVKAWKVERDGTPAGAPASAPAGGSGAEDDLPFMPVEGV